MTILSWLLDSDPALRWQVLRDLTDASADEMAAERARVAHEGWGAQLLAARDPDGLWAGGACFPAGFTGDFSAGQPWTSTYPSLVLLREFGVDPDDEAVREAIALVAENCRWEHAGQRFFDGEVEPCINGRTAMLGAYFGVDVQGIVDRLVGEQLEDGGWNCEAENGSVRASFHTTLSVLEGLLEYERVRGAPPEVSEARRRGEEYLLERRLMRRLSNGEIVDEQWLDFAHPTWWHFDVLHGLDYFRNAERRDPRLNDAVDLVRSKVQPDGSWLLDRTHPGAVHFRMEQAGGPSRWNTFRARRVLGWYDSFPA